MNSIRIEDHLLRKALHPYTTNRVAVRMSVYSSMWIGFIENLFVNEHSVEIIANPCFTAEERKNAQSRDYDYCHVHPNLIRIVRDANNGKSRLLALQDPTAFTFFPEIYFGRIELISTNGSAMLSYQITDVYWMEKLLRSATTL